MMDLNLNEEDFDPTNKEEITVEDGVKEPTGYMTYVLAAFILFMLIGVPFIISMKYNAQESPAFVQGIVIDTVKQDTIVEGSLLTDSIAVDTCLIVKDSLIKFTISEEVLEIENIKEYNGNTYFKVE